MTCYFDPSQGTFDAYDHAGTQVASGVEIKDSWGMDEQGRLVDPPLDFLETMRGAMEGSKPSAYNQTLLADLATNNFRVGTPP